MATLMSTPFVSVSSAISKGCDDMDCLHVSSASWIDMLCKGSEVLSGVVGKLPEASGQRDRGEVK